MPSSRHLARELVVRTIFAYEFRGGEYEKIMEYIFNQFFTDGKIDQTYSQLLLEGIFRNREKIIQIIQDSAPEWSFLRIAPIDRAILEIGVYEIAISNEVPPRVSVNECIELAKSYGGEKSSKFINAVLSNVMGKVKKTEKNDEDMWYDPSLPDNQNNPLSS